MNISKRRGDTQAQSGSAQLLRADAQHNYDVLVEAAAMIFASTGVDTPMKAIADRAGVGVGTVYRRFPKRSDLIVAVFRREVDGCADAARLLAAKYDAFEALSRWLQRYVKLIVTKRGLATALHSGEPAYESLSKYFEQRLVPSLQGLLEASSADVHAAISAVELLRAVALLCSPATWGEPAQTQRMVALLINGLRVGER